MRPLLEELTRQMREVQANVRLLRGDEVDLLAMRLDETVQSILNRLSEMQCWIEVLRSEEESETADPIALISPGIAFGKNS